MSTPDELTPETLRAVFHALWHSRMLVPGPTEEDCLAHVSAWAADRKRIEALERLHARYVEYIRSWVGKAIDDDAREAALRREEER